MNIENMKKARDYLKTVPQEYFGMGAYFVVDGIDCTLEERPEIFGCGTVGCALGHLSFCEDFGNTKSVILGSLGVISPSTLWDFLFDSKWKNVDNTVQGAVKRFDYLINGGVHEVIHTMVKFTNDWNEDLPDELFYMWEELYS